MKINLDNLNLGRAYLGILVLTIWMISGVSAHDDEFQSMGKVPRQAIITLWQNCANCTYVNLTTVYSLRYNSNVTNNTPFTRLAGTNDWFVKLNGTKYFPDYGNFYVYGIDNEDGDADSWRYDVEVVKFRSPNNLLYFDTDSPFFIVIFVILFFISLLIAWIGFAYIGGFILIVQSSVLLYNDVSFIVGMLFWVLGLLLLFMENLKK